MSVQTVIAVINEKGGTAKTTTSVSLSAALGALGQKVLLVDLDGQAASSRWLGVEEDNRLAEAMSRGHSLQPIPDVLPGVSLVPASGKLDSVAHDLRPTQGGQLRKVLNELTGYDFVIIDCPPSLGNRLIANGLLAATHALVPVETSILALDGLKILLTTLEDIRDGFGHEIVLAGVLACRYDGRTRLSRLVLEELRRALPGKVFGTVIRENVRMRECPASGQSILMFAPESPAAQDYTALAKELLAQPQAWRENSPADNGERNDRVGNLRHNAAASVRESTKHAAAAHATEAEGIELPPEPIADIRDASEIANTPAPVAQPAVTAAISDQAAADVESAASPMATQELEDWLNRLENAEQTLVAKSRDDATQLPADDADVVQACQTQPLSAQDQPEQMPVFADAPSQAAQMPPIQFEEIEQAAPKSLYEQLAAKRDDGVSDIMAMMAGLTPEQPQAQIPAAQPQAQVQQVQEPQPQEPAQEAQPVAQPQPLPQAPQIVEESPAAAAMERAPVQVTPQTSIPDAQPEPVHADAIADPNQDKFPALRAYLKQMQQEGKLRDVDNAQGQSRGDAKKTHHGFRDLLRKVVG